MGCVCFDQIILFKPSFILCCLVSFLVIITVNHSIVEQASDQHHSFAARVYHNPLPPLNQYPFPDSVKYQTCLYDIHPTNKMQFKSFSSGAAVLLALLPTALAGTATVVNNCGIPVYFASVAAGSNAAMAELPSGGYSQAFGATGLGISIKLSTSMTGAVTQFEFTSMSGGKIAYDMSNINGNPFAQGGMTLTPSMVGDSSEPTCVPVDCPAGEATCSAAYNQPNDTRTLVCNAASDLTLVLCSGAPMKRSEESAIPRRIHARQLLKSE